MNKNKNQQELDAKFWQNFSKNIWEKKPLILKNVKSSLLEISDVEVFNLAVKYSDICRKSKNPDGFKFYIDGVKTYEEDVLQFLPIKKDLNFLGYHKRMSEMFSDYCLVCDELLKVNSNKQLILTEFTNDLYRNVGFPNRFSEIGLYLGNYKKTPFGVHIDNCGVFSFPVLGVKKFRLWTEDFVKKNPNLNRAHTYAKYKKHSEAITARAGDMTYWPSSAWHIAESDGSFSATWSLGVWVDKTHQDVFSESLNELMKNKLGLQGNTRTIPFKKLHLSNGEVSELPNIYNESIAILKTLNQSEIQELFLKNWMIHISKQGFKNIPQIEFNLNLKSKIRLRTKSSPILWQKGLMQKTKVFICFAGTLIETTNSSGLFKIIQKINQGQECLVGQYIIGPSKKHDLHLLEKLAQSGAFV